MKIAVYAIALNEAKFAERFCVSARDADLVVVGDTGSGDDTIQRLTSGGAEVVKVSVKPWRFDHARNSVLFQLPDDVDVCVSLDLDEILVDGWRQALEKAWVPGATRLSYEYTWSFMPDGRPDVVYFQDKIHARHGYDWIYPCHEHLRCHDEEKAVTAPDVKMHHLSDPMKSRSNYLRLLDLGVKENALDSRMAFYHARELFFHDKLPKALKEFKRFLELPTATWDHERAAAHRYLGEIQWKLGNGWNAERHYLTATLECPSQREAWVELAQFYHDQTRWVDCEHACLRALHLTERTNSYMTKERAWREWPHDLLSVASWNLGRRGEAIGHAENALSFVPEDSRIRANLDLMMASG